MPTVMVIASDRPQARSIMNYVKGFLDGSPLLRSMVGKVLQESIELTNRVVIPSGGSQDAFTLAIAIRGRSGQLHS